MTAAQTKHFPSPSHNPWLAKPVRIQRIVPEIPGVATYELLFEDTDAGRDYAFKAGQFNMLYLPGLGEIAISVSGDPACHESVPHTIREAGLVTKALAELPAGSSIGLRGPFGSHWPVDDVRGRHVILIAGGIGLAPLRPAIYQLLATENRAERITLLIGSRDPSSLLYADEYQSWRDRGLDVHVTVDRPDDHWTGNIGVVTTLLNRIALPCPEKTMLLTCGPEVMMWYAIKAALARGLNVESMFLSLERNMNCAIGLCGHCQFGPEFLCKDGPVFRYDRVASILKVEDL